MIILHTIHKTTGEKHKYFVLQCNSMDNLKEQFQLFINESLHIISLINGRIITENEHIPAGETVHFIYTIIPPTYRTSNYLYAIFKPYRQSFVDEIQSIFKYNENTPSIRKKCVSNTSEITLLVRMHGNDSTKRIPISKRLQDKTNMISMTRHGVKTFECLNGFENIFDLFFQNKDIPSCELIDMYLKTTIPKVKNWLWEDFFIQDKGQYPRLQEMVKNHHNSSIYTPIIEHYYDCNTYSVIQEDLGIYVLRYTGDRYTDENKEDSKSIHPGLNLICGYNTPCLHKLQQIVSNKINGDDKLSLSDLLLALDSEVEQINIIDLSCRSIMEEKPVQYPLTPEEVFEYENKGDPYDVIRLKPWSYYRTGEDEMEGKVKSKRKKMSKKIKK